MLISGLFDKKQINRLAAEGLYIGLNGFSHRCVAYFNREDIGELVTLAHQSGKQLFIMLNRLYPETELAGLSRLILELKNLAVDGIVFSNHAVLMLAKQHGWQHQLIYQADTLVTNKEDAWFYTSHCSNVILAKEITLADIEQISNGNPQYFGLIVHGYLNLSYSRRLLLTNYLNYVNKSISLDQQYFLQEETREQLMPIIEEDGGTSIYSGFMLCSLEHLSVIQQQVSYLWIDPIFMIPDELEVVVDIYQQVMSGKIGVEEGLERLPERFNYSDGFYHTKTWKTKQEVLND
jgi:U32 family peptidase